MFHVEHVKHIIYMYYARQARTGTISAALPFLTRAKRVGPPALLFLTN